MLKSARKRYLVVAAVSLALILLGIVTFTHAATLPASLRTAATAAPAATPFTVPQWTSLRIRMDDTLTSTDSMEGDPFMATVMDQGQYQGAHIYGTVLTIDHSGRFRGHTSMVLGFNRLVMPDGRRAPIAAEIVMLYHAPSGESVGVDNAIDSSGRGGKTIEHTAIGAGAGALLGGIFGGGRGAGLGSIFGGAAGLGTTAFSGPQEVKLDRGMEMLIRITS